MIRTISRRPLATSDFDPNCSPPTSSLKSSQLFLKKYSLLSRSSNSLLLPPFPLLLYQCSSGQTREDLRRNLEHDLLGNRRATGAGSYASRWWWVESWWVVEGMRRERRSEGLMTRSRRGGKRPLASLRMRVGGLLLLLRGKRWSGKILRWWRRKYG